MTAQVVTEPATALVRGKTVVVGDSYSVEDLHGKKMRIASKGVVKCKGKDCGDDCVGFALFVSTPEDFIEVPSKEQPWRTGTVKICVTQLLSKKKQPLIEVIDFSAAPVEEPKKKRGRPRKQKTEDAEPIVKRRRGRPRKNPEPETPVAVAEPPSNGSRNGNAGTTLSIDFESVNVGPPGVTWDDLATAKGNLNQMSLHARALKARLEYLEPRYIAVLEKLAALLSA